MTTISIMCGLMEAANSSLDVLAVLASPVKNSTKCRDNSYAKSLIGLKNRTWGDSMDRQWTWQTCNEFGFFQSAGGIESPFHHLATTMGVDYYLQICQDAYKLTPPPTLGSESVSSPAPKWSVPTGFTNSFYGARSLGASRVVLPDGSVDPWHSPALVEPISPLQKALNLTPVLIDGTTHCGDMYYPHAGTYACGVFSLYFLLLFLHF